MIYIVDECMGRGKTCAAINMMNAAPPECKYLVVTPYLAEVHRFKTSCPKLHFAEPLSSDPERSKLSVLRELVSYGRNIVTTHALFKLIDTELFEEIKENGYELVLDEALEVYEVLNVSPKDRKIMLEKFIEFEDEDSDEELRRIKWKDPEYSGKLSVYKHAIEKGDWLAYSDNYWIKTFPLSFFDYFKNAYMMTYMFNGQYLGAAIKLEGIPHIRMYVGGNSPDTYHFSVTPVKRTPIDYRSLIRIVEKEKYNYIGDSRGALSKAWYKKHTTEKSLEPLKRNVYNFFFHYLNSPSENNIWTTFSDDGDVKVSWKDLLKGKGYTKGFLPCNIRGTNDYRDRTAVAYLVNRYPNTCLHNYFKRRGAEINQNDYALSEMLQFVWRSAIRDNKPIDLYVPSRRMRTLLKEWINILAEGGDVNDW